MLAPLMVKRSTHFLKLPQIHSTSRKPSWLHLRPTTISCHHESPFTKILDICPNAVGETGAGQPFTETAGTLKKRQEQDRGLCTVWPFPLSANVSVAIFHIEFAHREVSDSSYILLDLFQVSQSMSRLDIYRGCFCFLSI
mmetsp:Transcript_23254/g.42000  ORF Transcript_23254/g.42000 Transcript_23254/m.42000 type:complete len:140 (+) Transcript_23254:1042-1461(+)